MKVIEKTDARYRWYHQGFQTIVQFKTTPTDGRQFHAMLLYLENTYGTAMTYEPNGWSRRVNEHFRVEYNRKEKRRRIYLRDPKIVSILLMKAAAV